MKTKTLTQKKAFTPLGIFGLLMLLTLALNPVFAQTERAVKGKVIDEIGQPLEDATVFLQGSDIATDTNAKGEFTFPKLLKENDVLTVMHLGYKPQDIVIGPETMFIEVALTDYDIIIVGALKIGSNKAPDTKDN